jgi:hypothetical protein
MPSCDLQLGNWRQLDAPVESCPDIHKAGLRHECGERKLMEFQPRECDLPPLTNQSLVTALGRRKVRFIGDSVSWDHFHYVARCVLGCSPELDHHANSHRLSLKDARLRGLWRNALIKAGFEENIADNAIAFMRMNNGKEHIFEGCDTVLGGHVDVRHINRMPARGAMQRNVTRAILYGLVHIGFDQESRSQLRDLDHNSMAATDIVVLNIGLHVSPELVGQISHVLDWWKDEHNARRAPRLLWRQTTPQHWAAPFGQYRTAADINSTGSECKPAVNVQAADALPKYDMGISDLVRRTANTTDDWVGVLPVFAASFARFDEHPPLRFWGNLGLRGSTNDLVSENGTARVSDCTHWCTPGSVPRFWTQALVRWLTETRGGE